MKFEKQKKFCPDCGTKVIMAKLKGTNQEMAFSEGNTYRLDVNKESKVLEATLKKNYIPIHVCNPMRG